MGCFLLHESVVGMWGGRGGEARLQFRDKKCACVCVCVCVWGDVFHRNLRALAAATGRRGEFIYLPHLFSFLALMFGMHCARRTKKKWHTLLREMWKAPTPVVVVVWVAFYTSKVLHHESNRSMYSCELLL